MRFKDLTNKRFGKLLVVNNTGKLNNGNYVIWLCKCDCGNTKEVSSHSLNSGTTNSCGCLRKIASRKYNYGESSLTCLFNKTKNGAKKRGYIFKITKEELKIISKKNCFYCGVEPSNRCRGRGYYGEYIYNGLDRVDNNKGYIINNIVPCCKRCNFAKREASLDDFKIWVKKVYKNLYE